MIRECPTGAQRERREMLLTPTAKEAVEQHEQHDATYHHIDLVFLGRETVDAKGDSQ